ncbi:MAG: glycogen/starch/alpha-glucan phosphorylase [Desulfurococcales archaeon]|nr:glycogen/starch/alpha-glucan phosphorylase [Desulfurococcales archaeon]
MVIVSITPEIALDEPYTYAGGLGVLEGDKLYTAARMGLEYLVLSLFYRRGYVNYRFDGETPISAPQRQPSIVWKALEPEEEFSISLRGEEVIVRPWSYTLGPAKAVLFESVCPKWARILTDQVYIENSIEEQFLRYAFLAKSSTYYLRERIGLENISVIDLQEAHTALILLSMPLENRYRLVIHTPGPWGHPGFPGDFIAREFGAFIGDYVVLTEMALERVREAFVVSSKQQDVIRKVFPRFLGKIKPVTNGIDIERWCNPAILKIYREGSLTSEKLLEIKKAAKKDLEALLKRYKENVSLNDYLVLSWTRRLARYKRPDFIARFIEDHSDLNVFFILGGKPHPRDNDGLGYARWFRKLHLRLNNVVYIHDYNVPIAKKIFQGIDLLLFTPFSGWEACGTSYMKAGINGAPTLSSRDGGALELIKDGVNGWLFGEDIRDFIDIYNDPRAKEINEREYKEFEKKLLSIIDLYNSDKEKFLEISMNAVKTFAQAADIKNVLRKYYIRDH